MCDISGASCISTVTGGTGKCSRYLWSKDCAFEAVRLLGLVLDMISIVALATCHNRFEKTLNAVANMSVWLDSLQADTRIVIVDDGSTDGTGNAIRRRFPGVEVIDGNGSLFWAGGMRHGWDHAIVANPPDYLIVFNDDVVLDPTGMTLALESFLTLADPAEPCLMTAACRDVAQGAVTYGGLLRSCWWHPLRFEVVQPTGKVQAVDTCNMNFAILSRGALESIGFLDPCYIHVRADFDYGLRLRAAGGQVWLAPESVGGCSRNEATGSSSDHKLPLTQRWRQLLSIKEHHPGQRALYYRRHGGVLWPLYWALPYISFWLRGGRSRPS